MAATDRIENIMTQKCRIERSETSWDADLKMEFSAWTLVGIQRSVKCLLAPLSIGDEILALGPMEMDYRRLFLPLTTDGRRTNIERLDEVTVDEDVIWTVQESPGTMSLRGADNHLEVLVTRKAVQE